MPYDGSQIIGFKYSNLALIILYNITYSSAPN